MTQVNCPHEDAVARAACTNDWTEPLSKHAASCPICGGVLEAARWMQALAASADRNASELKSRPLPEPAVVWFRAQVTESSGQAKRIRTVVEWLQTALMAALPISLAGWAAWNWYGIEAISEQFLIDTWPQFGAIAYALASVAPAAVTLLAFLLAYPILASD